jgi:hypothetical protein
VDQLNVVRTVVGLFSPANPLSFGGEPWWQQVSELSKFLLLRAFQGERGGGRLKEDVHSLSLSRGVYFAPLGRIILTA